MDTAMDLRLDGKRVLVTGGTRGIGRAVVSALTTAGGTVLACHRDDQAAAAGVRGTAGVAGVVTADVTRREDTWRLAAECRRALGGLDVLVNNAGVDGHGALPDLTGQEWRRVLDTDLTATFLVTRAVAALLAPGASVINIGASVATRGAPGRSHYTAAKAGVLGLSRSLSKELADRGVRVNTLAPGIVETEPDAGLPPQLADRLRGLTALGRFGRPEEVAQAVLFLASDLSRYLTGSTLTVDGGL